MKTKKKEKKKKKEVTPPRETIDYVTMARSLRDVDQGQVVWGPCCT